MVLVRDGDGDGDGDGFGGEDGFVDDNNMYGDDGD